MWRGLFTLVFKRGKRAICSKMVEATKLFAQLEALVSQHHSLDMPLLCFLYERQFEQA
jgi:hypothetical protein